MHCNALVYCGLSLNCARAGFSAKARHIFKELIKNVQNVKFDKKRDKSKTLAKHTIQGMPPYGPSINYVVSVGGGGVASKTIY